ncbi:phosphatidate cytidylyltransferase [Niveibacterium umoris]|uniref:Phosphatidate cytidylyltransferase n=1 Tax=Niveibacterium umoris TaxID=1193620 RepID=A0A840BER9_9RHOO|nr:phosphatidate cytidylyltransferase [Niveibacterium umoris]MBB4011520.1 phosphatidate cytidylyltransferase [Niveibacterium umoris]
MLRERVITALVLLFALLAAIFMLPTWGWWGACGVISLVAGWEWAGLLRIRSAARWAYAVIVAGLSAAIMIADIRLLDAVLFTVSALFWMIAVPPWLKHRWAVGSGVLSLCAGLVVLVPAAVAIARLREVDPWFMLAAMALVWVADIGAYFGGRAFGRRKLAPEISPGKSWEGVYAGTLAVMLYGATVFAIKMRFVPEHLTWPLAMALLVGLTALSVLGDLFESMIKRQAGAKDSSALLPGHGGVLDRIDSLTSTLPLVALWVSIWNLHL